MAFEEETTGVANMTLLDNCDNRILVENLKKRLQKDLIYTYIGEVLISVNPYKPLTIYTEKLMLKYYNENSTEIPHIFATSAKVYKSLKEYRREQCILISGESGSGKTEASKRVLQFMAMATQEDHVLQIIKDKLLVANLILEAFGNARTRNNDNSSRFGKYMDVQFNLMGQPVGGNILYYLLEKSRVVKQAENERNYHIFYQLLNGADKWLVQLLEIDKDINYVYLRTDKTDRSSEDNASKYDSDKYKETLQALQVLEFNLEEKMDILKIIASILHLGNVKFYECKEICKIENINIIRLAAELLGVRTDDLIFALTNKTIRAYGEVIRSHLDIEMSTFAKDALAKAIYSRLFEWLVAHINQTLQMAFDCKNGRHMNKNKSIGILDIYGFEILQNNGFEQFCINYCNEKLQKLFIELTLKSEQQEYLNEGVEWTHVEYFDNGIICDMIEERHKGIISCLEDESLKQTDVYNNWNFLNQLKRRFGEHEYFSCYHSGDSQTRKKITLSTEFLIVHFAGVVKYDASNFLEKNHNCLFGDLSQIMSNSTNIIIKSIFSDCQIPNNKIPETTIKQFKNSLNQLIATIMTKQPSYIRCIKPNNFKEPDLFDDNVVGNQVRYMGLVEILRIRKAGYVYREKFEEFLNRYKSLCPNTWPDWTRRNATATEAVKRLVVHIGCADDDYKIGKTKILIKRPETVFAIERQFLATKHSIATVIQSVWRGYTARTRYTRLRTAAVLCQRLFRLGQRLRHLQWLKEQNNVARKAVFVQKNIRRLLVVRAYSRKIDAARTIRNFIKGFMTRNDSPNPYNRRFVAYKQIRYLVQLSEELPDSLSDSRWPEPPACCTQVSARLRILHRAWLARIYRTDLVQQPKLHAQLKLKLAASEMFKGKKSMYPKSVKIDFHNDRYGIVRDSGIIDSTDSAKPDTTAFLYATKVIKFDRRKYKPRNRILAVTSKAILIFKKPNKRLKLKDFLPLDQVTSLQMTSGTDNFLLIQVSRQLEKSKGDVLLEIPHIVECVTFISRQILDLVNFIDMQTNSCMRHDMKMSKNPGFIKFVPVAVAEHKGKIYKENKGNLMITY